MTFPNSIMRYIEQNPYQIDSTGLSGAGVYIFENAVLKVQELSEEAENEFQMLNWLQTKLPVPRIIERICENGYSYLLMSKCSGKMLCEEIYMQAPAQQSEILANALKMLWQTEIEDCPCRWGLDRYLEAAEQNVIKNNVDVSNAQPGTYGANGFKDPIALLEYLKQNKPTEIPVLSHGDFCLPNIFANKNKISGFIDLGRCGVGDMWQDVALCYRSLSNNYNGIYGGRSYPGFRLEMLFDALELQPDWERIRYYILLDELF